MNIVELSSGGALSRITDWESLGAYLGLPTQLLSYTLLKKSEMQKRIRIGDRIVYKSEPHLRGVQNRIMRMVDDIFETVPDTDCVLAYRQGITASDTVRRYQSPKKLVSFDIKKYFDNVTIDHIAESLTKHSELPKQGAVLVARYCTVKQRGRETLQQGSPASPVISNLVGYDVFDVPIREWLNKNYPELDIKYLRYCDNVALFIHDDLPAEFVEAFKYFVKEHCAKQGFRTHKWEAIADNNPHKHQKFLGVIVNAESRVDTERVDNLRAALFNWCRDGIRPTTVDFARRNGILVPEGGDVRRLYPKFKAWARGHIQYVKRINEKQGLMLEKLYAAAEFLDSQAAGSEEIVTVFKKLKDYKNHYVSVEEYLEELKEELKKASAA